MIARALVFASCVMGVIALAGVFSSVELQRVSAQSDADLLATIEALKEKVEHQERRLARLEAIFAFLLEPEFELEDSSSAELPTPGPSYDIEGSLTITPGDLETVLDSKN